VASPLDEAAHVIQTALTPIFMLTGIAQLLNVFTARLARVVDRLNRILDDPHATPRAVARLRLRSRMLDVAVVLAAAAGVLTCAAALILFTGSLTNRDAARLVFWSFGAALACAMGALATVASEVLLASRTARATGDDADRTVLRRRG